MFVRYNSETHLKGMGSVDKDLPVRPEPTCHNEGEEETPPLALESPTPPV